MHQLDEIDAQIVAGLQADAKVSLSDLGKRVGLSAPSVLERVRKLERSGVITGYHATVDARRLGLDIAAFIGVSIRDPKHLSAAEVWAQSEPQIMECHHVTGGHSLLMKVKTRNTQALEHLISRIRQLEGVERTETMVVLSTHTERVTCAFEVPAVEGRGRRRGNKRREETVNA